MPPVKREIQIDYFVFFWKPVGTHGYLSQWYGSTFVCHGRQFATAEQYMMYKKAELFNDTEIMDVIIRKPDAHPAEHKKMGRRVKNFNQTTWDNAYMNIVTVGNACKFTQNSTRTGMLLGTSGKTVVEASPHDRGWGIGFDEIEAPMNVTEWGMNKLGISLGRVRDVMEFMIRNSVTGYILSEREWTSTSTAMLA